MAHELITLLLSHKKFAPDAYGPYEPLKNLKAHDVDKATALFANEIGQRLDPGRVYTSLILERRKKEPKTSYYLEWSNLPHRAFDRNFANTDKDIISEPEIFLQWQLLFEDLCAVFESWYATCGLKTEMNAK